MMLPRALAVSRRSSRRSVHCDDDMSDSDDNAPLAPVAFRAAAAAAVPAAAAELAVAAQLEARGPPRKKAATAQTRIAPQPAGCGVVFGFSQEPVTHAPLAESGKKVATSSLPSEAARVSCPAREGEQTSEANMAQVQLPRAVKQTARAVEQQPEARAGEKLTIPAQIAGCKAQLSQLQKEKAALLEQEDYIGAHHLKEQIKEQDQLLRSLGRQLDAMPTPARRASMAAAKCSVGSGRAGAGKSPGKAHKAASSGGRSPACIAPNANAFSRSSKLTDTLHRMGIAAAENKEASQAAADIITQAEKASADVKSMDVETPISNEEPVSSELITCSEGATPGSEKSGDDDSEDAEDAEELENTGQWRSASTPNHVELPRDSEATTQELPFILPRETFRCLYPYQRAGVAWMARLWQGRQGGILADEMGLGKTVQVCAFLNGARKAGATHALLLLPLTLLDQWAKEARKWCPGWPVHVYYGSTRERERMIIRNQRQQGGLLLTSYQTLANTDALFDVSVRDAPSPKKNKRRQPGQPKRRKLGDDDEGEDFEDSDEEPCVPEMPGGGLPELGTTKPWDIVICDEAHRIKNISTLLGKTMRSVRANCRLLLTGTPVQNALQDLWSLLDFAQPGLLGNHATFVKHFSDPIDRGSFGGASTFQIELKKHLAEQLRSMITPHLLRRTKVNAGLMAEEGEEGDLSMENAVVEDEGGDAMAAKLPPKRETIVWLAPSDEQLTAYKKVLERSDVIREACSKAKLGFEVFQAIGLLKRLCNHPALLLKFATPGAWRDYLADATAEVCGDAPPAEDASADAGAGDIAIPSEAGPESVVGGLGQGAVADDAEAGGGIEEQLEALERSTDAILSYSSKLRCLNSMLPALAKRGHRTLVFCQSVKMLDLVQICVLKPNNLRCLRIDGGTDAQGRADKVNKFNKQRERFQCMLLTTNVGGVGLNLVSADRVILVDPAWNPATDAQAVDRAFRIGQEKEVRVYRLIMSGLIEDKMFRLQVFKMGLTKTALDSDQRGNNRYFSQKEISALFAWTEPAEGETRKMLIEKHGEGADTLTQENAIQDGAHEAGCSWMEAAPAVGLSDFAQLYSSFSSSKDDEEQDEECTLQVSDAKEKLGAADEKLQQKQNARQAAEERLEKQINDLELTTKALEVVKERKTRVIEAAKESNSEAVQERRCEASAQTRLEKALRAHTSVEDQKHKAKQLSLQTEAAAQAAERSSVESLAQMRTAEEVFATAYREAQKQPDLVNCDGSATKGGQVEASGVRGLRALQKAFELVKAKHETMSNRQVELDFIEQELSTADAGVAEAEITIARLSDADGVRVKTAELNAKKFRQDRQKSELAQTKARDKVDAARELMTTALQGLVEAGANFVESLQRVEGAVVKMDQVKLLQTQAKTAFKQFSSSFTALRKAREAHSRNLASQRKAMTKSTATSSDLAEIEQHLEDAQLEHQKAVKEEKKTVESRRSKEQALAKAEAARSRTEAEEADLKRRRDELKAGVPVAKEALKAAKAADKEALNERQALHSASSKVERQHSQMEIAKNSAMEILKAEEYDANQVEKAYTAANS